MTLGGIRFLVLLADGIGEEPIRAALPPAAPLWVSKLEDSAARADQLVDELSADVVLVGCHAGSEAALNAIRRVAARRGDCAVVVLYEGSPNGFLDPAFEAGADDLITLPQGPQQLAFAIEKVIARRRGPGAPADVAPMISVLGPKGGTGKTLTACNLAVSLAEAGCGRSSSTSTCSSATSASRSASGPSGRSTTSRSSARRSTAARSTASSSGTAPG